MVSAEAPAGVPVPAGPGLRTVTADGTRFRVAARERAGGRLVEVGADLAPLEERVAGLRNRVIVLSLLGAALCGLTAWWLAGLALRPLAALRAAAAKVSTTRDLSTRLPESGGPEEVDTLSSTVNAMLARLEDSAAQTEAALDATRRFAADAGHERERVFKRFARADGAGEGSGLGLALVRQQAELHGDSAQLERSPRGGARAAVRLALGRSAGFA